MMSATSGISIWMSSTAMSRKIEEIIEGIAAKEFSKHILGISEHKWEARAENEIMCIKWIATSSTMVSTHALIVIYQTFLSVLIINSSLFLCKMKLRLEC